MTIAVSSYQRRAALKRLLESLRVDLRAIPDLCRGLDVVVTLDGSTDGSLEMLEKLDFPVPLSIRWQANQGLAAARNACLEASTAEIIWFLDDDMVLPAGLLARHRDSHEQAPPHLLMGPCIIPTHAQTLPEVRGLYEARYAVLTQFGRVRRFDQFSAANTSGPTEIFRSVGGFDQRFVGYGIEDYDIGLRLLERAIPIWFNERAAAWHLHSRDIRQACTLKIPETRNKVRMVLLHPHTFDQVFPPGKVGWTFAFYRVLGIRSARMFRLLASVAVALAELENLLTRGRKRQLFYLAVAASTLAGAAEADPDGRFLGRLLGLPEPQRPLDQSGSADERRPAT